MDTSTPDLMALILLRDLRLAPAQVAGLVAERRARRLMGSPTSVLAIALEFGYVTAGQATRASALYTRLAYRPGQHTPLGYLLFAAGHLTGTQLAAALAVQQETGGRLGHILVDQGAISVMMLKMFLALQLAEGPKAA